MWCGSKRAQGHLEHRAGLLQSGLHRMLLQLLLQRSLRGSGYLKFSAAAALQAALPLQRIQRIR